MKTIDHTTTDAIANLAASHLSDWEPCATKSGKRAWKRGGQRIILTQAPRLESIELLDEVDRAGSFHYGSFPVWSLLDGHTEILTSTDIAEILNAAAR